MLKYPHFVKILVFQEYPSAHGVCNHIGQGDRVPISPRYGECNYE